MTFDPDTYDNEAFLALAADTRAAQTVAERGLELRVAPSAGPVAAGWLQAVTRGFLEPERDEAEIAATLALTAHRRRTGVYDPAAPVPDEPVATFASWIGELAVPGGTGIPACAISSVTVAPTHRRRGLLRAMMEGELRLAAARGVPIAALTVSESAIYGRFGFAPAAAAAQWTLNTRRATWIGPVPDGRVDFVPRERWRAVVEQVHERVRLRDAGELSMPGGHFERFAGTRLGVDKPGAKRAIQYTDAGGTVRGAAVYAVRENHDDFAASTAHLHYLVAETADAYAALWRFLVELDLVATLHASELSADEPLLWMIADQRAARITVADHQYVRILDLPAALEARRYGAPGRLLLDVADPLGFTAGRWLLEVGEDGRARVTATGDIPPDAVSVRLSVTELSAVFLGGVSPATLADAGRVAADDIAQVTRVFGWYRTPRLSYWY